MLLMTYYIKCKWSFISKGNFFNCLNIWGIKFFGDNEEPLGLIAILNEDSWVRYEIALSFIILI